MFFFIFSHNFLIAVDGFWLSYEYRDIIIMALNLCKPLHYTLHISSYAEGSVNNVQYTFFVYI